MGVFMQMRDRRREWSGHAVLLSGPPSWWRFFGCLVLFLVLTVAVVGNTFSKRPSPNLAPPIIADIVFGAAAIHQWMKLRRLRVNAPPPRQKRHRKPPA